MDLYAIVYSLLSDDATLAELVSDRITPEYPTKDSTLPAVSYEVQLEETFDHLRGQSGLRRYTVTIDVFSLKMKALHEIEEAVVDALDGYATAPVQRIRFKQVVPVQEEGSFRSQVIFSAVYQVSA